MQNHSNHMTGSSNNMRGSNAIGSNAIGSNPCTDVLSDEEYLVHMIPHHQVAIDMSILLQPKTTSADMQIICREIIRTQSYEIFEMKGMQKYDDGRLKNDVISKESVKTKLDVYNPTSANAECNPLFFKPNDHSKHMATMKINDTSYLEHMIPHHQVAIDMSRRLLLHTNNSYLIYFCRKLIVDQQGEILYMKNLLKSKLYKSDLLW